MAVYPTLTFCLSRTLEYTDVSRMGQYHSVCPILYVTELRHSFDTPVRLRLLKSI